MIKNIVAVTGKYTAKDGTEKKQYTTIWKLLIKDDGNMSVKIDTVPLGWDGWANIYEVEKKKEEQAIVWTWVSELPF